MRSRAKHTPRSAGRVVECLACGTQRVVRDTAFDAAGECPRCRYVGWSDPGALTGTERVALHRSHRRLRRGVREAAVQTPPPPRARRASEPVEVLERPRSPGPPTPARPWVPTLVVSRPRSKPSGP
jgi:hypothetical protein